MKLCLVNLTIVVKHKLTTFVKHKLTMFVKHLTIIVKHWLTIFVNMHLAYSKECEAINKASWICWGK